MVPTKVTRRFSVHATQPYCQNKWSKRPRSEAWSPPEVLEHVHLLVGDDVSRIHQIGVDGDAPLVVDVRLGDGRAVDLRFQHVAEHFRSSF